MIAEAMNSATSRFNVWERLLHWWGPAAWTLSSWVSPTVLGGTTQKPQPVLALVPPILTPIGRVGSQQNVGNSSPLSLH